MRLLATLGRERNRAFPDVPTVRESGWDTISESPFGIGGPNNMDPAVVRTLHDAFKKTLDDPARVSRIIIETLSRRSTQRDLDQARQFVSDFRAAYTKHAAKRNSPLADPDVEAWARYCHAIFASSEFLYRK